MDRNHVIKRWSGRAGAMSSYPTRAGKWPDRDAPKRIAALCEGRVCEVGCGTGRVSEAFKLDSYVGVDINPEAILYARRLHPGYLFGSIGWDDPLPEADTYLYYTVLLHIPDEEIMDVIGKTKKYRKHPRVVVFESMDRLLRERTAYLLNPYLKIFQRNPEDYEELFLKIRKDKIFYERLVSDYDPGFRDYMVFQ